MTINSLVDICVRSGDLDRAYRLLKNPTLYPSSSPGATAPLGGGGGDWAGAVDKVDVEVEIGAADMVDSPWGEGGDEGGVGDSGYEAEGVAVEVEVGRAAGAAAVGAGATGGYGEAEGGAWRGVGLVRPSVEAFTSVLTGFAGVGDKDRALAVFQQVRQRPRHHNFLWRVPSVGASPLAMITDTALQGHYFVCAVPSPRK